MAKSVVVFGMAHSGKSTCIGYMYNKTLEKNPEYSFEAHIAKLRREIPDYDDSRDYGYLVDEFVEDRIRTKSNSGRSKRMHLKPVELGGAKITLIDTPGSQHKAIQRQKGMFYGDVGVFCIEINQLTSDDFYTNKNLYTTFIATLILWSKFNKRIIVALTKMDQCGFQRNTYLKACEIIKQICDMVNVAAIVPISVDVKGRKAHNIYSISDEMLWYKDLSLSEALVYELEKVERTQGDVPLLFYVDRSYLQSRQYTGQSWRIKILQGEIRVGEEIALSPMQVSGSIETITAKVKTLRSDLEKTGGEIINVSSASEGSFVGIDLCEIKGGNRKIGKRDLRALCTSCGFSKKLKYKSSDHFIFKTNFHYWSKFDNGRQMDILWFGRAITFQVVNWKSEMDGIEVTGRLMNKWITMPRLENGEFMVKDIIIRYDHNPNENPFIEAELLDIVEGEE